MISEPAVESERQVTSGREKNRQTATARSQARNSDVRKEQNKNASRVYRERRKQRLALLEQLLEKERSQKDCSAALRATAESPEKDDTPDASYQTTSTVSNAPPVSQDVTLGTSEDNAGSAFAPWVSERLTLDLPWPIVQKDWQFDSPIEQPDINSNKSALPRSPDQRPALRSGIVASTRPIVNDQRSAFQLASSISTTTYSSALTLDQTLSPTSSKQKQEQPDESLQSFFNNLMSISAPDVKQVIYVQQNGLFGAIMENTLALGLLKGAQMIFSQDGTSPFNKDWIESKGAMQLSEIKSKFATTPKDLQPVDIQITFEHHVYIDVVPFPIFRDKALKALTCDPPLFDEDELCIDITENAGLIVWGSQGNDQGMDACRPWDMRSWEPKPWFLRKYWYLCGGWEDEMWKAARWWHAMRNERIGTRPPDLSTLV